VNVNSKTGLLRLAERHPDALAWISRFYRVARKAKWRDLADVRREFATADQVGQALIFNARGNRYRLILTVSFVEQRLFAKALLTHAEYDRKEWMKWARKR
jgi:mRNA interferase HigB